LECVRGETFAMDIDQPVDHVAFARPHTRHVGRDGSGPLPVFRRMPKEVGDLGAADHVLAWQAGDVRALTTDQRAFHDDDATALSRKLPGDVFAGLAAAEDEILDFFAVRHRPLSPIFGLRNAAAPARPAFQALSVDAVAR